MQARPYTARMRERIFRIGLISDTHGLLRPEAIAALQGSDAIIHAGDIGDPGILDRLVSIAPVTAVRGNNDREPAYDSVPEFAQLVIAGISIDVIHDLGELLPLPARRVVVSGHSHRPRIEMRDGVLRVNPGSAGPRRFKLPVSVARLTIADGEVSAELIELQLKG